MVFVPAVMGAGMVFSVATLLRDVLARGSHTMLARQARLRGRMLAEVVVDPESPALDDAADLERRPTLLTVALLSAVFGLYVLIGASANFFEQGRYVSNIAWVWGGCLVVATIALAFAVTCLVAGIGAPRPPHWIWPILLPTPLTGAHDIPASRRTRRMVIWATTIVAGLTVLALAAHVLDPVDRAIVATVDRAGLEGVDWLGRLLGSTRASLVAAIVIGIATLRCRRFAWFFLASVVLGLATTQVLRVIVDRPRPAAGPSGGATDSFPSGHLVQATLLAVLLPIAVHELTRARWAGRATGVMLTVGVALVAVELIANARHEPTDVIAGASIGLAVGGWARLALFVPGSHDQCRRCSLARAPTSGDRADPAREGADVIT